jgi:rubredoxin
MHGVEGMSEPRWTCLTCGAEYDARPGPPYGAISDAPDAAPTDALPPDAHVFELRSRTKAKASPKTGLTEDPWFQQFWEEYPRKVGKKPARNAWQKCIKGGASPAAIIDAAKLYALMAKRSGIEQKYLKYPQGWLADERFEDEVEDIKFETPADQIYGTPEYEARMIAEGVW